MKLTQAELMRQLGYDADTGVFTWIIKKPCVRVGSVAGRTTHKGYREIRIDFVSYQSHRLAWLYVYGAFPEGHIDHVNGNPADNRIANLRIASRSENMHNISVRRNSSTGVKGVSIQRGTGKYKATISAFGVRHFLGYFDSLADASAAYAAAAEKYHGEFRRAS